MELVDEEEDVAILLDLIHDRFDPLFELAAVFCAGDHERQIERDQFFLAQIVGNFSSDDRLGKPFDNRCFSNARFSDENGVVFAAAAEDQDQPFDFFSAADHGIHFPFAAHFGQIVAIGSEEQAFYQ